MAQHLPPDILFHIFTSFLSPDQYLNGLMLVCHDWYSITNYEMFWLATLKNLLQQQINDCKKEHLESLIDSTRENSVIKKSDVLKERNNYLSNLEKKEKILIVDLKPFTSRRETNDDIYGNSYKNKTMQCIKERRRRMVALELGHLAIQFENHIIIDGKFFEEKWKAIISAVENNIYYDKRFIAQLGIFNSSTTIFHIFIKQYQVHFVIRTNDNIGDSLAGDIEFFDRVVSFFVYECGLPITPFVELIIKAKGFATFLKDREKNETIFEKFKNEVNSSAKGGANSHLFMCMINNGNMNNDIHVEFVRKCVELFKSKKLLKFKESMLEPYTSEIIDHVEPNPKFIELLLKDCKIMECKGFEPYDFINILCSKIAFSMTDVIEILKQAKDFGLKFDFPLPVYVTNFSQNKNVLKFLVENGSDINTPPPSRYYQFFGVPLASVIYNSYNASRCEEIMFLLQHGATLPPIDTEMPDRLYSSYTYANIFDYYYDHDEKTYLPTLKILVEKFGPRFSRLTPIIEKINSCSKKHMSLNGLMELIRYLKQVTTFNEDDDLRPFPYMYRHWKSIVIEDDSEKQEEFREFVQTELPIKIEQKQDEEDDDLRFLRFH